MEKVKMQYGKASTCWIFGLLCCFYVCPDFIKAIFLMARKESLGGLTLAAVDFGCVAAGSICAFAALFCRERRMKESLRLLWNGYLPCLAALYAGDILQKFLGSRLGFAGTVAGMAVGYLLFVWGIFQFQTGEKITVKRGVSVFFFTAVCCFLLPRLSDWLINGLLPSDKSWGLVQLKNFLCVFARWLVLVPFLNYACGKGQERKQEEKKQETQRESEKQERQEAQREQEGQEEKQEPEKQEAQEERKGQEAQKEQKQRGTGKCSIALSCVSLVILLAAAVLLFPRQISDRDRLEANYYSRINLACYELFAGNLTIASNAYEDIWRELESWQEISQYGFAYISEDEVAENPMLAYLDAATREEEMLACMEKYYTEGYIRDTDFYFSLLSAYKKERHLTKEQENRRREILTNLAAEGIYAGGLPEVKKNAEKMAKIMETASEHRERFDYVKLLARMRTGDSTYGTGISADIVSSAVNRALEKPEDFAWNYLALLLYNHQEEHLYNSGLFSVDRDIVTVAGQFDSLFEEYFGKSATAEETLLVKKFMMQTYLRAMASEEGADYGLEALQEFAGDSYLRENTMYALFRAERYEECLKLAEEGDTGTNPAACYYGAAAALCDGKYDVSVKYALELAERVKKDEYPVRADELLYAYLGLLREDNNLPDSILQELKQDDLFQYYLAAYEDTYGEIITWEALERVPAETEEILKIRENLCYPYYLQGVAYFQQEKYEEAAEAYRKAIDCYSGDAMIWYALHVAYAELGDWENAYAAGEIAMGQSDWGNYYSDDEGSGIHLYSFRDDARQMILKQQEQEQKGGEE